jgi:hypothetical protein
MKATLITDYNALFITKGAVYPQTERIFITCPSCGQRNALPMPPFTFTWNAETFTIGPASISLPAPGCGWHGYMRNGEWIPAGDSKCTGAA